MDLDALWRALEQWSVAETVRTSATLYPAVETAHLIGAILVIGTVVTLDIRLLGASPGLPAGLLGRHVLVLTWIGFGLAVATGLVLFATRAASYADNPAMQLKAVLLVLAGLNSAAFHVGPGREMLRAAADWTPRPGSRPVAALSLIIWLALVTCAQWIAYTDGA